MVGMTSLANPRVAGNGGDTDAEVCNGRETLDPKIRRTLLGADSTRLLRACSNTLPDGGGLSRYGTPIHGIQGIHLEAALLRSETAGEQSQKLSSELQAGAYRLFLVPCR